jgi:hypothetical protein
MNSSGGRELVSWKEPPERAAPAAKIGSGFGANTKLKLTKPVSKAGAKTLRNPFYRRNFRITHARFFQNAFASVVMKCAKPMI